MRYYILVNNISNLFGGENMNWNKKLQKYIALSAAALVLGACADSDASNGAVNQENTEGEQVSETSEKFTEWYEEETVWRTVQNVTEDSEGGFIHETDAQPSQDDLQEIIDFGMLAPASTGKQDFYMVAVTDPEEQENLIGDRFGQAVSEGTATVLIYSERLIRDDLRTDVSEEDMNDPEFNSKFAPDRGYYNAGIATGYLDIAASALGYGTHMYMSPALPGENGFDNGSRGQDAYKYLEGAEYYDPFLEESFSTENMKFVCAVVIGTPNEEAEADTITGVTLKERPDNYHLYSGQEVEEGEATSAVGTDTNESTESEEVAQETSSAEGNALTGEAEGLNGPVVVEVIVDGDTITDVTVVEHDETPSYSGKAIENVPDQIVENNGTEGVDVASGATYTSKAIIEAVENALSSQ